MTATPHGSHRRILASAGTGKTYQLASRYLQLVLDGADPRTILATTFTRAAAAEIRARILTTAAEAVLDEGKRTELAARTERSSLDQAAVERLLQDLVEHLRALQVQTIDSTFARIAGAVAPELGLPEGLGILESDEQVGLEHRALAHALSEAVRSGQEDAFLGALDALGKGGAAGRSVVDLIDRTIGSTLLTYHDADGDPTPWRWARPEPGTIDLARCIESWRSHARDREALVGKSDAICKALLTLAVKVESALSARGDGRLLVDDWKSIFKSGIGVKVLDGETTYSGLEIEDDLRGLIQPIIDQMHEVALDEYAGRTASTYYLLHLHARAREEMRSRLGVATFADVVRLLRETRGAMVREDLWFRLDARIQHLMLDEFQDTSLAQWKVLRPLAEEIVSDATGERSFFCVGDTKQSIYGWRGGLPGILEHLDSMILSSGARVAFDDQTLSRSYRSAPQVLDAVNAVFGTLPANRALADRCMGAAKDLDRQWVDHEPARPELAGHVEMRLLQPEGTRAADLARASAREAATLVAELHEELPGCSIGVLAPRNDVVGSVVAQLRSLGVDATGEGGGSFLDCGATVVMLDALHLAGHPGTRASAFNVLKSPLGPIIGLHVMEDAVAVSRALRKRFAEIGIAAVIEAWIDALAGQLDRRETARTQRLVVETDRLERAGERDPAKLSRLLERTALDEPGDDAVRVMTIHKSKGLEFDVVVLTGLDGNLFKDPALACERPLPPGDITRIFRWTSERIRPPAVEPLHEMTRVELVRERLCQLYVAMTRARRGLFLLVGPPPSSGTAEKGSMAGVLRSALTGFGLPGGEASADDGEPTLAVFGTRAELSKGASGSSRASAPTSEPELEITIDARSSETLARGRAPSAKGEARPPLELLMPGGGEAARIGNAWHHLVEQVEWIETWEDSGGPEASALVEVLADRMPGASQAWYFERVQEFLASLTQPEVRQALSRSILEGEDSPVLHREWGWFGTSEEGHPREGIIDRLVLSGVGAVRSALVIDWKTDRVPDGGHLAHAERYRPQLDAYRAAVSGVEGIPLDRVGARVVFLRDGVSVEL